jgi:hypothetical protein
MWRFNARLRVTNFVRDPEIVVNVDRRTRARERLAKFLDGFGFLPASLLRPRSER